MKNFFSLARIYDILIIFFTIGITFIISHFFPQVAIIRVPLSFVLLFLFPGYILCEILFFKSHLILLNRVVISIVFSICIVVFSTLILYWLGVILTADSILLCITLITLLLSTICLWIRKDASVEELPAFKRFIYGLSRGYSRLDKVILGGISLILVLVFTLVVLNFSIKEGGEQYTEFFLSSVDKKAVSILSNDLIISLTNYERSKSSYKLTIKGDNYYKEVNVGDIKDEGSWSYHLNLSPDLKNSKEILFSLFINGSSQPYRQLHLYNSNP